MRLVNCLTLSVVACNLLMAVAYKDWSATNFNQGDTITIDHNPPTPPQPPLGNLTLNQSITINGNVDALIKGNPAGAACGVVGCFTQPATISGNGTINFNVSSTSGLPAFGISRDFSITSGFSLSGLKTAFQVTGGNFKIETSQNQSLSINGDLNFINATNVEIVLKNQDQKINGNISAQSSPSTLTLSGGSIISGNFTGSGGGNRFNLSVEGPNSLFQGNIKNNGTANIKITNGGKVAGSFTDTAQNRNDINLEIDGGNSIFQGNLTNRGHTDVKINNNGTFQGNLNASGDKLELNLNNGNFIGNITTSTTQTNTIQASGNSSIAGGITTQSNATITLEGNSEIRNGTSSFNAQTTLFLKGSAKASNEVFNITRDSLITFQDNAQTNNSKLNINGGSSNLTFQNNTRADALTIQTTAGKHQIVFKNNSTLSNGQIVFNGGTSSLDASDQTSLAGTITQTGGTSNINFKNQSKMQGNFSQTGGDSKITLTDTTKWTGNIEVKNGTTEITLTGPNAGSKTNPTNAQFIGNINAAGANNKVTFTQGSKLTGNLTLDGWANVNGTSTADITKSHITGNIQGYDIVNLTLEESQIDGVLQQGGSFAQQGMKATINKSTILQGFKGESRSNNELTITDSVLKNGITQNTGSLKIFAMNSSFTGGFTGSSSINSLQIASSSWNNGDFIQTNGSLKAELVNLKQINNFTGTNSNNVIHLSRSEIKHVSQNGGRLELKTDSHVQGNITGSNNSRNIISIMGADVKGNITQTTGSMELTLSNGSTREIQATNASLTLNVTDYTAQSIHLKNTTAGGSLSQFILTGTFSQEGGTSNLIFADSQFRNAITLLNTQSSNLVFTKSSIQNIQATNGNNNLTLSDGTMQNFTGTGGTQGVTMTNSNAGSFNQTGGSLTINASSQSKIQEIAGNQASLAISLNKSQVTQNIRNTGGNTTLSMQDSDVQGNVSQLGGLMVFNATDSTIQGQYTQTNGTSTTNLRNSQITQGINFNSLATGTLTLDQNSKIEELTSTNSTFILNVRNQSIIEQKLTQSGGNITGNLSAQAKIQGELILQNGITSLTLSGKSQIQDEIQSTNNSTTILVDDSSIDGNIIVNGKFLDLTAQNNSTITSPQLKLTNADLKLTLDTQSKFIGDLNQTNNKQDIVIRGDSLFQGNITNTDTASTISVNHSKITGNLSQTRGSLRLDLSNQGIIGANVTLNNVTTTLSGSQVGNQIAGNFTQNQGELKGSMHGLNLEGTYSQTGGISEVSFLNSTFKKDTLITNATQSSLSFIQSTLKSYTTDGGQNTLKLLDQSNMQGDLTLKNTAKTLLEMNQSTLTGNIQGTDNSLLTLNLANSKITGNVSLTTGGVDATIKASKIQGSITLNQTNSKLAFDRSEVGGDLTINGGNVKFNLSNGTILHQNLIIKNNAIAHISGAPDNNIIQKNISLDNSQLTGDISSLKLKGKFIQNQGTSTINFRHTSIFEGEVNITEATSSHLKFINLSGINNKINITKGNDNTISLENRSFIKGDITTQQAKFTLNASDESAIIGNIKATQAIQTTINLKSSALTGDITQTQGILELNSNQSATIGSLNLENLNQATLNLTQSSLIGKIQATNSNLTFKLDRSTFNTAAGIQEAKISDSNFTLQAENQSLFAGDLIHSSTTGVHTSNLSFLGSTFMGKMDFNKIQAHINFKQSKILSDSIQTTAGKLDLSFDDSTQGGVIKLLQTQFTPTTITAQNKSNVQILKTLIEKNTLKLKAQDSSRLTIDELTLTAGVQANYEALSNGNLNVNTHIKDNASTLIVNLHGGILQGIIIQDHLNTGDLTLSQDGGLGGRWALTGDSQIKSLHIVNDPSVFEDGVSIFSSALNTRLSFVDFTMHFSDQATSSRVGQEMIIKPAPNANGIIPPAGAGQTYARELKIDSLSGNGLFRIYADLGSKLADQVVAQSATGEHFIQIYYRADTFRDIAGDRIVVAKVADSQTDVIFKGTQSDVGLTRYDTEIIKENAVGGGFEWIIGQATPSGLSYASKIIASILQSQYRLFAVETDSLDRRLGGLENIQRDKGFWARSFFGQSRKDALSYSIQEKDTYYSVWSGLDHNVIGLTGHNFLGTFFNYTNMESQSKAFVGKSQNFSIGFYDVFKAHSGFYFDILVKYIYSMSDFDISSYALAKNKPSIKNHKFLANFEAGHTFYLGEKRKSLYIQPQFQITGGYIQGYSTNFIDVTGEKIQATLGHNAPAIVRLGTFVGQSFGEKFRFNIKGGSSLVYEINSGGELNFKDSSNVFKTAQKGDFKMLFSAHADLNLGESFRLYSSFDTSFFGTYNTNFNLNIGLRLIFGKRNNVLSDVPMVYNPYTPPPPPIEPDQRNIPKVQDFTTRDINANYTGRNREIFSQFDRQPRPINRPSSGGNVLRQNIRDGVRINPQGVAR